MNRILSLLLLLCASWAGDAVPQDKQDEIWRKAMEESQSRKPIAVAPSIAAPSVAPVAVVSDIGKRRERAVYWEGELGVRFNAERMTVAEMDAEAAAMVAAQLAQEEANRIEAQRQMDAYVKQEQEREQAERIEQSKRRDEANSIKRSKAIERAFSVVAIGFVIVIVSFVPWSVAAMRQGSQNVAVGIMGAACSVCGFVRFIAGPATEVPLLSFAIVLWVTSLVVAVWKRPGDP
jgi:ABC-type multidrug transport system fused ATPase/permease subunit